VGGTPAETHARYRGRPGAAIAVLTLSKFPAAPRGQTYQVWVRHGERWTALGTVEPDADGSGRLIAESPALASLPDAVEITLEPRGGASTPSSRVIVSWAP
jgi:anti-sigma-K factor RskA